jgi:hypothetical protein
VENNNGREGQFTAEKLTPSFRIENACSLFYRIAFREIEHIFRTRRDAGDHAALRREHLNMSVPARSRHFGTSTVRLVKNAHVEI